jgi:DNA-binding NarL/FixJ family response regulator
LWLPTPWPAPGLPGCWQARAATLSAKPRPAPPCPALPAEIEAFRPDAVVWDVGWNAARGAEQLALAGELGAPVIALLPDADAARNAWIYGVQGLLLRSSTPERIMAAISAAAQGSVVLAPEIASVLVRTAPTSIASSAPPEALTPRELDVLRLMAEGLPNKAIAARLGVTEHTIKFHVNAVLAKLGAQSRTEAVVRATRLGLIPL